MSAIIQARDLSLRSLTQDFNLDVMLDMQFFEDWLKKSPAITDHEQSVLQRIQTNYDRLSGDRPLLEDLVKMVVLSPLLDWAGFYQQNVQIKTEEKVEYQLEDRDEVIRGVLDFLIVQDHLWLLVIETKNAQTTVNAALTQLLFYMLNGPSHQPQTLGLITNGLEFMFVNLERQPSNVNQEKPQFRCQRTYALSMEKADEFEQVFRVLKWLPGALKASESLGRFP